MKVLVLGSHGLIGSYLCNRLVKDGHDVIPYDIKKSIDMDLRTNKNIGDYIKESDFVFFLAFDVGGSIYLKINETSYDFIDNNVKIMQNTFDALKKYNKPFIFTSTQMSTLNFSNYGTLKALGEHYCRSLNSPIIKLWNVYGIEEYSEKSHVITDFIKMAKTEKVIRMKTTGNEMRQFLHVDDCVEAFISIMNNYDSLSREQSLDITSFEWIKIIDLANMISSKFESVKIIPSLNEDNIQYHFKCAPNESIYKYWKPTISISEGLNDIILKLK